MATFDTAKVWVARTIGGQNDPDQLAAAGDAIKEAIQEWNLRRNWNFLLMDNSDDPIDVEAGTELYTLPSTIREPHSARLLSQNRTLSYVIQRDVDRAVRSQSTQGIPTHYTLYNGSTPFSADTLENQVGWVKLIPIPSYSSLDELLIRYYRTIRDPNIDSDTIDVPDRFLFALLARAKYYYMVNKDAESARTQHLWDQSERLWMQVVADDEGQEDRDVRFIPQMEHGAAFGPDLKEPQIWVEGY